MTKRNSLLSLVLAACLCFMLAVPAWAAETDEFGKVMPSDIIKALNGVSMFSDDNNLTNDDVITRILEPTSLGIDDIINIDVNMVHQTYPLLEDQIALLKEHGYNDTEIAQFDMGDFFNIEASWILDEDQIRDVRYLYPELNNVDISNWTLGRFMNYCSVVDEQKYAPSPKESKALIERNITLKDARNLLKDYYTYENILAQSDEQLASDIKNYYEFNICNITNMAKYEDSDIMLLSNTQISNQNMDDYIWVQFPGYKADWFHKDSGTTNGTVAVQQSIAVQSGYECIYNVNVPFKVGNLHGTFSTSKQAPHEGIDFNTPNGFSAYCTLYSIAYGNVYQISDRVGQLSIYADNFNVTASLYHMNSITPKVNDTIKTGDNVGQQGKKATDAPHAHFEINAGKQEYLSPGGDSELTSLSPYFYITWFVGSR